MIYTVSFLLLAVVYIAYDRLALWHSRLSKVPGPPLAAITRLVLMYYEFTRRRRQWIHHLHMRYGPTVRIAPNEVSFTSWDAVKEIYVSDGSGYDKTVFYSMFDNYGTQSMFSTLDRVPHWQHGERRRRIADKYSKSYVMQPDVVSAVQEHAEEFVAKCTEKAGAVVDIYLYLHCYALDAVTHHLFDPFGLRSLTQASDLLTIKDLSYHDNLRDSYLQYYVAELFGYTSRLFRRQDRDERIAAQVLDLTRRSDIAEHTVLHRLQSHKDSLPTREIASEILDHAVAGADTTGDGLCFLLYHLSLPSSSAIQEKLRRELEESYGMPIDDLPYLDAVVKEGLRCFGPLPMGQPRRVPPGGSMIDGFFMPQDTIVSCQSYTLHRLDTKVFPDPEEFIPERWLESEGTLERNQLFFAFGTGGRGCIGKHFALLEMKLLLKEVYSTYRTRVAAEMTASMEADDQYFSSRPKGQQCLVTFEKIA